MHEVTVEQFEKAVSTHDGHVYDYRKTVAGVSDRKKYNDIEYLEASEFLMTLAFQQNTKTTAEQLGVSQATVSRLRLEGRLSNCVLERISQKTGMGIDTLAKPTL